MLLAKVFPGRRDAETEEATGALLLPKKSRTKDDDEGRERLGEREGIEVRTMYRSLLPNRPRSFFAIAAAVLKQHQ
jgi:hypothetical protein